MAFVDDIIDTLVDYFTAQLAPYQPNVPPDYINTAATAGQIVATLVAPGHPIQLPVTTRLENKQATIAIYDGKLERDMPFVTDIFDDLPAVNNGDGSWTQYTETGRKEKEIIIEVWSFDQPSRRSITNLIVGLIGDYLRLTEADGTITVHRYVRTVKTDQAQDDSVYINQVYLMSDFSITQASLSYTVVTTELDLEINV